MLNKMPAMPPIAQIYRPVRDLYDQAKDAANSGDYQTCVSKIEPVQYPFGKRNHKAYLAATSAETQADSPWRAWLRENYQHELETRIKMKNRLPSGLAMTEPRFIELWSKFVSGETDLLA